MNPAEFAVPAPENFPRLEEIFAEGQLEPFRKRMDERRAELRAIAADGAAEARRASTILAAYEQALALVDRIDTIRNALATSAASAR